MECSGWGWTRYIVWHLLVLSYELICEILKETQQMHTSFSVGDSASKYILTVSGYSGTAGDSLRVHNGYRFSTRDQDNGSKCAQCYKGGWWYILCLPPFKPQWSLPWWSTLILCWLCELVCMEGILLLPEVYWDENKILINKWLVTDLTVVHVYV